MKRVGARKLIWQLSGCGFLLVAVTWQAMGTSSSRTLEEGGAYHRGLSWQSPPGQPERTALYLARVHPQGTVFRYLFLAPSEWRLIYTERLDPASGLMATRLLDDETGWWACLSTDSDLSAASLEAWRRLVFRDDAPESPPEVFSVTVATSNGFTYHERLTLGTEWPSTVVFADLERQGRVGELSARLPRSLVPAILFLDASLGDASGPTGAIAAPRRSRDLLGILADALRAVPPAGLDPRTLDAAWPMANGRRRIGGTVLDPHLLEITSRFRHVDNTDPLSDVAFGTPESTVPACGEAWY
jgi:hypothetical protein